MRASGGQPWARRDFGMSGVGGWGQEVGEARIQVII